MYEVPSWHEPVWQYLRKRRDADKLPHAILIKGMNGVGKAMFAQKIAELFLCKEGVFTACGKCQVCQLLRSNTHPDLLVIEPEEVNKVIKIDQVREVISHLNLSAHQGGNKVVIVQSAELLNIASVNALLKTLEEPTSHTIIILVSAYPMLLPATIRSRCQTLLIMAPEYLVARKWLEQQLPGYMGVDTLLSLTENAPFRALAMAKEDILTRRQEFFSGFFAFKQNKISLSQMIELSMSWRVDDLLINFMYMISDLVKIKFSTESRIINRDKITELADFATKTTLAKLFSYQDHLYNLRKNFFARINLNQQMVIENLLLGWLRLVID